jgi:hypothetical protein
MPLTRIGRVNCRARLHSTVASLERREHAAAPRGPSLRTLDVPPSRPQRPSFSRFATSAPPCFTLGDVPRGDIGETARFTLPRLPPHPRSARSCTSGGCRSSTSRHQRHACLQVSRMSCATTLLSIEPAQQGRNDMQEHRSCSATLKNAPASDCVCLEKQMPIRMRAKISSCSLPLRGEESALEVG